MPEPNPAAVGAALARLLDDPALRERLGRAGIETAKPYAWESRIDALERFLEDVARRQPGRARWSWRSGAAARALR